MKILVCVHNFNNGGAERVASLWIKGFIQRGYSVTALTCGEERENDYDIPDSVNVVNINPSGNILSKNIRRIKMIRNVIKGYSPDVIIILQHPWIWWIPFAKIGMNIPIVNTEHNSFERPTTAPMPRKTYFEKFYLNRVFNVVTVLTEADKNIIGKKLSNVCVLPNPLAFEPIDHVKDRDEIVLAMGRLDVGHTKGFDVLIKAFGMTNNDGWLLKIAGGGKPENVKKYKEMAEDYGIANRVEFLGYVKDPASLFRRASIFVLSSRYEGFGLVVTEAMSQGCACIACDYKGRQSEIILDQSMGMVCPTENAEALAECINRMINDSIYRESIRKNAIERSKDFTVEKIIDRWDEIFRFLKIKA